MKRRVFLSTIAGGLLAAPFAAEAQQAGKVYRIGFLGNVPLKDAEGRASGACSSRGCGARTTEYSCSGPRDYHAPGTGEISHGPRGISLPSGQGVSPRGAEKASVHRLRQIEAP